MNRKLNAVACILTCLSLVGCSQPKDPYQQFVEDAISSALGNTDKPSSSRYEESSSSSYSREEYSSSSSKQEESKPEKADLTKYELLAQKFVQSVQKKDWTAVQSCLDVKKLNFITNEDLEWVLPRTSLADLADSTGTITVKSSKLTDKDKMKYSVTCECDGKEYDVEVRLMDDNSYKVFWNEAIITDWYVSLPVGCKVTYGELEYNEDAFAGKATEELGTRHKEGYASVVKRPVTLTLHNALGDSAEGVFTPASADTKARCLHIQLADNTSDRVKQLFADALQEYQAVYTLLENNGSTEEIMKHLASNISIDYVENLRAVNKTGGGSANYKFTLDTLSSNDHADIIGDNAFYLYTENLSGTRDDAYFMSPSFSGRKACFYLVYEDGQPKLGSMQNNTEYMFQRFKG